MSASRDVAHNADSCVLLKSAALSPAMMRHEVAELNDELKKLGLRVRHRVVEPQARKPGHIAFDDRGNAVYEWDSARLAQDGEDGERLRQRALDHPGLSLAAEETPANAPIRSNPKGLRVGYNPYESGLLASKERKKKRNLHELSKWIATRRKLDNSSGEE
jgi:hypothetical protein